MRSGNRQILALLAPLINERSQAAAEHCYYYGDKRVEDRLEVSVPIVVDPIKAALFVQILSNHHRSDCCSRLEYWRDYMSECGNL
jgi:hypothetical protein